MSRTCDICGKGTTTGRQYTRRGLAKKKGGVGKKITGKSKRTFKPNLQSVKLKDASGKTESKKVCAHCLRAGLKKGTLSKVVSGSRGEHAKAKAEEPAAS